MGNRRKFTAKFKAEVVLELLSGAKSSAELCREHQIAASVLADWKTIFLSRAAWLFENPEQHDSQQVGRIAELERLVGRLTLENDLLKKATSILHPRSKTRARYSPPTSLPADSIEANKLTTPGRRAVDMSTTCRHIDTHAHAKASAW